jgi:hypothetical protein
MGIVVDEVVFEGRTPTLSDIADKITEPNWIQAPEVPVCGRGHAKELLLSCASEYTSVLQAPVQERALYANPAQRDWAAVENAANAPRIRYIADGVQFTFICRRCPAWPIETISQC